MIMADYVVIFFAFVFVALVAIYISEYIDEKAYRAAREKRQNKTTHGLVFILRKEIKYSNFNPWREDAKILRFPTERIRKKEDK